MKIVDIAKEFNKMLLSKCFENNEKKIILREREDGLNDMYIH